MAQAKDQSSNELIDVLAAFEAGVNMGVAPVLLPKNQLAAAVNTTLRGDLLRPRPPFQTCPPSFNQQQTIQAAFQTGNFQGAGYYKPDTGPETLVCSIGGHLYQLTPTNPGALNYPQVAISDISIPGDTNPATQPQAWMWQTEKWLVLNDAVSLPIFFDGTSSRRALQFPPNLGTITATTPNPLPSGGPPGGFGIGSTAEFTLSQPWTSGANVSVYVTLGTLVDQYTFSPLAGAQLTLQNVSGPVGKTVPAGSNLLITTYIGTVTSSSFQSSSTPSKPTRAGISTVTLSGGVAGILLGQQLTVNFASGGELWKVTAVTGNSVSISGPFPIQVGALIYIGPGVNATVVGTTLASAAGAFSNPAAGQTVVVSTQSTYGGTVGDTLFIGASQYTVTAINNNVSNVVLATFVQQVPPITTPPFNPVNLNPVGATVTFSVPGFELPPGKMGAYVSGRNWVCLTDGFSYIASDLIGDPSGSSLYKFRDAVLKVTENTYLVGGGAFTVPNSTGGITAMIGLASLNAEFNAGPLQVGTPTTSFSVNTPVDRSTWSSTTNPLQAVSIISNGPLGQNSSILVNGDWVYRAVDGLRSLILQQSGFYMWGSPPQSREIGPVLAEDPQNLLTFGSSIVFDNRRLDTSAPVQTAQGVIWQKITVMNLDPVSTLRGKAPSIYEASYWQDLNVLQLVTGQFSGVQRAFAFVVDSNNLIQLVELLPFGTVTNPNTTGTAPTWQFDTPFLFKDADKQYKTLVDCDLAIDQITGPLEVQAWLRPDFDETWWPWTDFKVNGKSQYDPRLGLDLPPRQFNPANDRPVNSGYTFQVRIQITGWCRLQSMKLYATKTPEPQFSHTPSQAEG